MPDALASPCPHCGAPASVLGSRCLFCLGRVDAGPEVAARVVIDADLSERLERAAEQASALRAAARQRRLVGAGLAIVLAVVAIGGAAAVAVIALGTLEGRDPRIVFALGALLIVYGGLVLVFLVNALTTPPVAVRTLSRMRPATIAHGSAMIPTCPGCGAHLPATHADIVATCRTCDGEALLPFPMVDARLRGKQVAVVDLQVARRDASGAMLRGEGLANVLGGCVFVLVGLALAGGFVGYVTLHPPAHLHGLDRVMATALPALFMLAMFGGGGAFSVWRAWRRTRG